MKKLIILLSATLLLTGCTYNTHNLDWVVNDEAIEKYVNAHEKTYDVGDIMMAPYKNKHVLLQKIEIPIDTVYVRIPDSLATNALHEEKIIYKESWDVIARYRTTDATFSSIVTGIVCLLIGLVIGYAWGEDA